MVDFDIRIPTKLMVKIFSKIYERIRDAPVWGAARIWHREPIIFLFWKKSHQKVFATRPKLAFTTLLSLLEHEILHCVLDEVSGEARHQLDNIHDPFEDGFSDFIS